MSYTITAASDMLTEVRIRYTSLSDSARFLLTSDVHFDNPKCDRELFFSHLKAAQEAQAGVFCFGDFFDVMGAKHDKRRAKSLIRPEYAADNYLQAVVMDTAQQLAPYRDVLAFISDGNHETAIKKNQEVDLLKWLIYELRRDGSGVVHGGYHGFVRFVFEQPGGGKVRTLLLYYHHGKFGGSVTKGVLSVGRFAAVVPQADVIVSGHVHERWKVSHAQYHLKANGEVETRPQHHIKCSTYKEEFTGRGGWAVEKIALPKPMGGWWMEISPNHVSGCDVSFWEA